MVKAHSPINWENEPSYNTPINEANLNKMDSTIGVLDDRIIEQETSKLDKATAYTMVKDISFNENNGVFTITLLNGSTKTLDTKLEKIAINFKYDYSTQKLIVTLIDGTTQSIDMSALLTQYEFTDSATLDFTTDSSGKVTATIKSGSITEDMLQPNYLAEIKVETEKSAQSMANAKISENNAKQSELNAKESEEKALEYSNNAQPLAQSVSGMNPTATNSTDGKVIYLNNEGYTEQKTLSGKNLIDVLNAGISSSLNGLTITKDKANGYLILNGTTTAMTDIVMYNFFTKLNSDYATYRLSNNLGLINWWYDGTNYLANKITTSETVQIKRVFVRIESGQTFDNTILKIQVEKGDTATEWEKYCGGTASPNPDYPQEIKGLGDSGTIEVKTRGKNHLKNKANTRTVNGITFTVNSDKSITLNGTATTNADILLFGNYGTTNAILETNKNKVKAIKTNITGTQIHFGTGKNSHGISTASNDSEIIDTSTSIITWVLLRVLSGTTLSNKTIYPMIVDENTTDTTYEPYTETTASIPVTAPLYDGDYIEVYADGSGKIYRNMGSIVYDGSTYGFVTADGADLSKRRMYSNAIKNMVKRPPNFSTLANIKSTHYTAITASKTYFAIQGIAVDHNGTVYLYDDTYHTSASELNTWLQSNPITVVYELAEPTSTPLTAEQVAEFMKLQTFKPVTHVTADGEITVRYYCNNDSGDTVGMLHEMVEEVGKVKIENIQLNFTLNGVGGMNEMTLAYHLEGYADKPNVLIGVEMDSGSVADAEYIHVYSQKVTKDELRISAKSTHPTNTHTTNFIVHVTIVGIKE